MSQEAQVKGFGTVWFDESSLTNIFSHAEMADQYRITYDNHDKVNGDSFVVHLPQKSVTFRRLTNKLYVHHPRVSNEQGAQQVSRSVMDTNLVNTVDENRNFYTARQFKCAKCARDMYHVIGTPSIADFKTVIRMNAIGNNPVTTKDIDLAKKLFGADIGQLKCKSFRHATAHVVEDEIDLSVALFAGNLLLAVSTAECNGNVSNLNRLVFVRRRGGIRHVGHELRL